VRQFLLLFSHSAKLNRGIELFPKIILINKFLAEADPEIELLVPTFLGNDPRKFYGRGVPKTMSQKFESSI
jgi:hypothetical protein